MNLVEQLKTWRDQTARREGVESYFVLHYDTLEAIARERPASLEALGDIKGMGPKKIAKYGHAIIAAVNDQTEPSADDAHGVLTVSQYLARLNETLAGVRARLRGEIAEVKDRGNVIYFKFRDRDGDALLSCLVFASRYRMMGVELRDGLEVIIAGAPSVWPRTGSLSFRADTVELVGEGKLQQAYLALKQRLADAGLFAPERKRKIPRFAQNIGLITASQSDAYFDFAKNLLPAGLTVAHADCHVEGARAIPEIIHALKIFQTRPVDVIVIVRGGGSWEALQAFNSEAVCRAIAVSRSPVLAGIGHERDVPLAALAADQYVSTPSLTAIELSQPWREAKIFVAAAGRQLQAHLTDAFLADQESLRQAAGLLTATLKTGITTQRQRLLIAHERSRRSLGNLWQIVPRLRERIRAAVQASITAVPQQHVRLHQFARSLQYRLGHEIIQTKRRLEARAAYISSANPRRLLAQGYSLVRKNKTLIRSPAQLQAGDLLRLQFGSGGATAVVQELTPNVPYDPNGR